MARVSLKSETRELKTKNTLQTLRKDGKVPGVYYGQGEKTQTITVNGKEFEKLLHSGVGKNVLIDLAIDGKTKTVIIKEIQRNLLDHTLSHVDFLAISMKEKIEINVPVHLTGTAIGVKDFGGILEHMIREIKVKCLPNDIPASINIDVTNLNIGDGFSVKDLPKMEGVDIVSEPSTLLINVVAPMKIEEVAPAAGDAAAAVAGAPAEPEVISKGKKDKEEEGAVAAPAGDKKAEQPKK